VNELKVKRKRERRPRHPFDLDIPLQGDVNAESISSIETTQPTKITQRLQPKLNG
jgi:hypothetical protein